jgi:triosephosphate isomerase
MRKRYIIGNWKMNKTMAETKQFILQFDPLVPQYQQKDMVVGICPAFLSLQTAKQIAKHLIIAAQNCHEKLSGAFTGEVSIPMLQEIGIGTCLVGHSERRLYNNETNASCHAKILALLQNNLTPIYCVGETLHQYESNQTKEVVANQIKEGLANLPLERLSSLIVAYEPVWSIGTGKNASSAIAQSICHWIRHEFAALYGDTLASSLIILYGGSVKADNVTEYMACEDVDGVLVGGASLDAKSFQTLIDSIR